MTSIYTVFRNILLQLAQYSICCIHDFKISIGLHALGHPLRPEGHSLRSLGLLEGHPKQVTDCGTMLMIDGPFKYFSENAQIFNVDYQSGKFWKTYHFRFRTCDNCRKKMLWFLFEPSIIFFLSFYWKQSRE